MKSDLTAVFLLLLFLKNDFAYCNNHNLHSAFVVHDNLREVSALPILIQKTRSEIECAVICQRSDRCKAANYMESEQKCYLFSELCIAPEDVFGWRILTTIPLPRIPERSFFYVTIMMTWNDAKAFCESFKGDLANIYVESDLQKIKDIIETIGGNSSLEFWLAGNDNETEGLWLWSNGCPIGKQPHDIWAIGEPNNCCEGQNCLRMQGTYDRFYWDDFFCSSEHAFMCEMVID